MHRVWKVKVQIPALRCVEESLSHSASLLSPVVGDKHPQLKGMLKATYNGACQALNST